MAFMSGSDSISCAVARSSSLRTKAVKASTTGSSSARSRELAEAVHVGRGVRFGEHGVDLDEAMAQMLQPAAHG